MLRGPERRFYRALQYGFVTSIRWTKISETCALQFEAISREEFLIPEIALMVEAQEYPSIYDVVRLQDKNKSIARLQEPGASIKDLKRCCNEGM
jgi:hypothetical protein